jgi:UDP-N-acetylmuramyl tripeptide synthase
MSHAGLPLGRDAAGGGPEHLTLRTELAAQVGALAGRASTLLHRGRGGTLPGRVTLLLAPEALRELTADRRVILVSGTNGKTTTTRYVAEALGTVGAVVTNADGDNLARGLVSALLRARRTAGGAAVLEVDEAVLPTAVAATRPAVVLLLNLSRDQLDRTAELTTHVARWSAALAQERAPLVVANADDPLIAAAVMAARPRGERVVWVGAGSTWRADTQRCPVCGGSLSSGADYRCESCDFGRPVSAWRADGMTLVGPEGITLPLALSLPGAANRGNAALAVAAAVLCDVPVEQALSAICAVSAVSGRYQRTSTGGHHVQLLLAKNPAGWTESLAVLADRSTPVVIAVNARTADGTDPSWLWDVPFERLRGRQVVATGERRWDLAVRLKHAEVAHDVAETVPAALATLPPGDCDLVANYTAFRQAQVDLVRPGRTA